jgi:hypothetical protein
MFLEHRGKIPVINCAYEMTPSNDKISFWYDKDSSNGYEHKYSNYIQYLVKGQTVYKKNVFIYELLVNRGGIQYFSFVRAEEAQLKTGKIFRKLSTTTGDEQYIVKVFDVGVKPGVQIVMERTDGGRGVKHNQASVMSLSNELVLVPKDMIQKAFGMALKFG